jgi:hypothetical protein
MGRLDEPLNTFWQLFFLPRGGSRWADHAASLATATNGGLILVSPDGRSLLVGVRPTNLLNFSPLVTTPGGGRVWSPLPPVAGLADRPDALATGSNGALLALTTSGRAGEVLSSSPHNPRWATLITGRSLASSPPGRGCGILALTAVAYDASGSALVGAACDQPGVAAVYVHQSGSWRQAGPKLPASLADDRAEVLSLRESGSGIVALIGLTGAAGRSLVGARLPAGSSTWTLSPSLDLTSSAQLLSFGPATGSRLFVLLSAGSGASRVEITGGTPAAWNALPEIEKGVATVAFGSDGRIDALVAGGTTMRDYVLHARSDHWQLGQTMSVNILYGSSQ